MIDFKYPTFNNFFGPKFNDLIMDLLKNKELYYREETQEESELKFVSKISYNQISYLIVFNKNFVSIEKVDNRYFDSKTKLNFDSVNLMSTRFVETEQAIEMLAKMQKAGFEDNDLTYPHFLTVSDIDGLKQFFVDMECKDILDNFHLLIEDFSQYDNQAINDLNYLFSVFDHPQFKKTLVLGDYSDFYHKYMVNDNQVITYSNTSSGVDSFFIFEKNIQTGDLRIWAEDVCNIDTSVFKFNTIVIGKYKKIIEHYINNKNPCFEYKEGKVIKNSNTYPIHYLYFINANLSEKLKVDVPFLFDNSSYKECMEYVKLPNLNWLYSAVLWNGRDQWKSGTNGSYLSLNKNSFDIKKRKNELTLSEQDYGYISIFDKESNIMNVPLDVANDWKQFIVDGYWYVLNHREKMAVCSITDKDIDKVTKHLKSIGLI